MKMKWENLIAAWRDTVRATSTRERVLQQEKLGMKFIF